MLATIGADWYRCIAHPDNKQIATTETIRFPIVFIEDFSL
jgi:hypothetical protein